MIKQGLHHGRERRESNGCSFTFHDGKRIPSVHIGHRDHGGARIDATQKRQDRSHMEHRQGCPEPVILA